MESVLGRDEPEPPSEVHFPLSQLLRKVLERTERERQGRLQQYRCQELREKPSSGRAFRKFRRMKVPSKRQALVLEANPDLRVLHLECCRSFTHS